MSDITGTGDLDSSDSNVSGRGLVIKGKALSSTQTALEQDLVYRPAAHYPLSEAEFNLIVDPPARPHQWLPQVRGTFLGALIVAIAPVLPALYSGGAISLSTVPASAWVALGVTSVLWFALWLRKVCSGDPQKKTIERIRRTWDRTDK